MCKFFTPHGSELLPTELNHVLSLQMSGFSLTDLIGLPVCGEMYLNSLHCSSILKVAAETEIVG